MEELCRLCLTVSSPLSLTYLSSTLTQKIEAVLPVQVIDNNFLPKNVCSLCTQKIEEIHDFHLKVSANQNLLLRYLNEGVRNLHEFYLTLKNKSILKIEVEKIGETSQEFQTDVVKTVTIKEERDSETNYERQIVYTNVPVETEHPIKEEVFDDGDDNGSNENHLSESENVKKEKDKIEGSNNKTTENIKKGENLDNKGKTEENDQSGHPDKVKTEPDNNMENDNDDDENDNAGENDQNDRFKCLTCFTLFTNKDDLLNHYRSDHLPEDYEPETVECRYTVINEKDDIKFKCEKCDYSHHIRWYVQRHAKSHAEKKPFHCKICGRTYKTAMEIYIHGRAHTTAKMECHYQCGFTTAYKGALKNHEMVHRAEYKYTCYKCNTGFHTRIQLIEHENKHNGVKPFVCDICGYAFHMRRYLQSHRSRLHPQSSNTKRYLCVHCSLPCDTMNALNEHMKAEHEKRTDFLCDICGKTLKCKEKLTSHKRIHLGIRPFECNICGKKLTKKSTLIIHINGHTKARSFTCICGKKYTQQSALNRHQKTKCRQLLDQIDEPKDSTKVEESQKVKRTVKEESN